MVRLNPDAIILPGPTELTAATLAATSTIPIVLIGGWPDENGSAASLARPGGTITGLALESGPQYVAKMLQMFKQAVPRLRRVAILGPTWTPGSQVEAALGLRLLPVDAHPSDPEDSFARIMQLRADAVLVGHSGTNYGHRKQLGRLAYEARLPSIDTNTDAVEAGALMSYGPSLKHFRRVAHYIDKISKGAKPGDLPIELPTKYELTINLKTAKAHGPHDSEVRSTASRSADRVIATALSRQYIGRNCLTRRLLPFAEMSDAIRAARPNGDIQGLRLKAGKLTV